MKHGVDKWFLGITLALVIGGGFILFSAALGLLAENTAQFSGVIFGQFTSACIGLVALFIFSRVHYRVLQRYSLYFFLAALGVTALVFIPGWGVEHSGAVRWLAVGTVSFQPAELLKLGFVLYFAAWLAAVKQNVRSFALGLVPLLALTIPVAVILLAQPDTGTFAVILATALAMFLASGGLWRYFGFMSLGAFGLLGALIIARPYVRERLLVFFDPSVDPQGAGYQLTQSLIAIASGLLFGRGFGQSIQKFTFLPEPISDSIFAVFVEEFGFVGGMLLITAFVLFAVRGLIIAVRAPNHFARLTVVGIVILITSQAFLNIGSMLGVVPLTGLPLPFVSHGGTALIMNMAMAGIVLNISRYARC